MKPRKGFLVHILEHTRAWEAKSVLPIYQLIPSGHQFWSLKQRKSTVCKVNVQYFPFRSLINLKMGNKLNENEKIIHWLKVKTQSFLFFFFFFKAIKWSALCCICPCPMTCILIYGYSDLFLQNVTHPMLNLFLSLIFCMAWGILF